VAVAVATELKTPSSAAAASSATEVEIKGSSSASSPSVAAAENLLGTMAKEVSDSIGIFDKEEDKSTDDADESQSRWNRKAEVVDKMGKLNIALGKVIAAQVQTATKETTKLLVDRKFYADLTKAGPVPDAIAKLERETDDALKTGAARFARASDMFAVALDDVSRLFTSKTLEYGDGRGARPIKATIQLDRGAVYVTGSSAFVPEYTVGLYRKQVFCKRVPVTDLKPWVHGCELVLWDSHSVFLCLDGTGPMLPSS
jgi:hypothetical protein